MSAKVILVLCAQALFIQTGFSSCLGRVPIAAPAFYAPGCAANELAGSALIGNGLINNGYAGNCGNNGLIGSGLTGLEIIPTSGGGLAVFSTSAFAPSGLSITSENVYEGALSVAGELPFVSAVDLEGVLPSGGAGAVSYSLGNGVTAIESIAPSAAATYGAASAYGLGTGYAPGTTAFNPAALGFGCGNCGCGCGVN